MGESNIKKLEKLLEKVDFSKGFATTQELLKAGIKESRELTSLCRAGVLIRHRRGVYKKSEADKTLKMRLIANKIPDGVFGEATMLYMYKLIDKKPEVYTLAVPRSLSHHKRNEVDGIPISVYYFDDEKMLRVGKVKHKKLGVYIYDLERTICDCFSRRNKLKKKLGDDFSLEDISERYLNHPKRNIEKLAEYEHLLSGILKCPICGANLYGNVNRKKKKEDGTYYKDYFFYACKHRKKIDGVRCYYDKQWNEETINGAVEETIRKVVRNPEFEAALRKKIDSHVDTSALDTEMENLQKVLRQHNGAKDKLGREMDMLDITDKHYNKKYEDMQTRLEELYDKIDETNDNIAELQSRIDFLIEQKISSDNVYKYLLYFDKLYDKFTDMEKKTFLNSFIERIEIYPRELPNGRILKSIHFKFPLFYEGEEIIGLRWDNETTLECVVLLTK